MILLASFSVSWFERAVYSHSLMLYTRPMSYSAEMFTGEIIHGNKAQSVKVLNFTDFIVLDM